MIQIGELSLAVDDPRVIAVLTGTAALLLILWLLAAAARRAKQANRAIGDVARHMGGLSQDIGTLAMGQERLGERVQTTAEGQAQANLQIMQTMELRLAEVQTRMNERLHDAALRQARSLSDLQDRMGEQMHQTAMKQAEALRVLNERVEKTLAGNSVKTTESLTQLQERLAVIDRAQGNIEKLSGDVLSLQDILSNKQTRGAFGEIQLNDIVSKALPSDAYSLQPTLSNGSRPDCLIHLPNPPGPIVIDAKFPLEDYERLVGTEGKDAQSAALKDFAASVRTHIRAIADKYLIDGETADGALMFLPSEAVYAELHARLPGVVREGFDRRVWIVSPTTCMATLNTMRAILKDARMREQAGAIRKALKHLHRDVEIIGEKAGKLEVHLRQAGDDVAGVLTAASRAGKRAERLDSFDFEELEGEASSSVVPLARP